MPAFEQLVAAWDGVAVVTRYDASTDTWIFICLHDNTLGAATGGTRMARYSAPEEGLVDAMRLSEGMTNKWAAVDLPFGGGKAVLALARSLTADERRALLHRYGDLVESLRGAFRTGEDLGTGSDDMMRVAERTRYIHGFDSDGTKIDPSPFTAHGVLSGMRAAAEVAFGSPSLVDRTVLVEGVGNVGSRLADELHREGASLLLSDIDERRAAQAADRFGAVIVHPEEVAATRCDIYSPCAVGATVNQSTIPQLACRVIAGSANNQLGESADAARLLERDIIYVPDFIINAGGAMSFAEIDRGRPPDELLPVVERIGETTRSVLREALDRAETTLAAAKRRVEETLARARAARDQRSA